ncbi:MAG: MBL fold metallo-hydrolase [Gammaproteobacteria bacterium]|nr:MBL fold metallo-hydrolase [Gammaproteobacteria bacterium]MBT3724583.1 MBL fold metallo-hydrolase [Gammaproteobacteria bacterium]MBT4075964.1 MBL fold metallo-hydrolase [Gammaproteobacteria bacterium]MBT4193365.1 MBL fold metallo-hydrolase [Gammaproteobacteria bacterium]MBT4451029.1 MBL fold metallo-hydrolase [Gammaproteobacteria bacterium]
MQTQKTRIHALELGPMENFIYLIEDTKSGQAAVVDPAWDVNAIVEKAQSLDLKISDILLTHSHHDHINGIEELLNHSAARVHLLKPEYEFWSHQLEKPELHHGGDCFKLGSTEISMLHTPGHTPGSVCYQIEDELITGDTLFVYGCGRCDLHGGNPEQMFNTLKGMKHKLDANMVIHPGHNYSIAETSTLAKQIDGNPFMHFEDEAEFINYRMHVHDKTRQDPYGPLTKPQMRIADLLT